MVCGRSLEAKATVMRPLATSSQRVDVPFFISMVIENTVMSMIMSTNVHTVNDGHR